MPINIDDNDFPAGYDTTLNLVQVVKSLVYQVKQLTGKSSWKDAPSATIETLNTAVVDFQTELTNGTLKGDKGDDGLSAYQVAVANGYSGTQAQWLLSLKGADGVSPTITPGSWQTVSLSNSFTEVSGFSVRYRLLADGRVEIKGGVALSGVPSNPTTIFTLPTGFRPSQNIWLPSLASFNSEQRATRIVITTAGLVQYAGTAPGSAAVTSLTNLPLNFVFPRD